jgi:trafficking protein particle complex subunit 8
VFISECSVEVWITETFWIDLVLRNPLDAEVNLSNVTVILQESNARDSSSTNGFVDVELVDNVVLAPRESRTVRRC